MLQQQHFFKHCKSASNYNNNNKLLFLQQKHSKSATKYNNNNFWLLLFCIAATKNFRWVHLQYEKILKSVAASTALTSLSQQSPISTPKEYAYILLIYMSKIYIYSKHKSILKHLPSFFANKLKRVLLGGRVVRRSDSKTIGWQAGMQAVASSSSQWSSSKSTPTSAHSSAE